MAHKIDNNCINCGSCEDACPVGAISEGEPIHVIDSQSCIDCGACDSVCPTGAIIAE